MNRFLFLVCLLLCGHAFGANPTFQSFNTNYFSTNNNVIAVRSAGYTNVGVGDSNSYAKWKLPSSWNSGISRTPVMGFNNYYKTGDAITQTIISNYAQVMIDNGLRDAGYRYVVMDAGVYTNRDSAGNLVPNGNFPNITNLISWLHTNGFKVGIWQENTPDETHGSATSSSTTNHNKFLERDIALYAATGYDYIKFDTDPASIKEYDLNRISTDIANTGRPMFLHGATTNYQSWMNQVMNSWRAIYLGDIAGPSGLDHLYAYFDYAFTQPGAAIPGHFWSFDIVSGLGIATGFEVHLTGVGMWSAELITANVDNAAMNVFYTNQQFLAINQDLALAPPIKISSNNFAEIWVKPLGTRSDVATNKAVALFNRNSYSTNFTVQLTNVFPFPPNSTIARVYDVWNGTNFMATNSFTFTVAPTNAALFRLVQGYNPDPPFYAAAYRTSNYTTNSTTALFDDNQLQIANVPSNRTYKISYCVTLKSADNTPGFNLTLAVPTPITGQATIFYQHDIAQGTSPLQRDARDGAGGGWNTTGAASLQAANTGVGVSFRVSGDAIVALATNGTVKIRWAQFSSQATLLTNCIGSFLEVRELR